MARTLGRNHDDIEVGSGLDLPEVDVETVGKCQRCPFLDVGLDVAAVNVGMVLVRQKDHDQIGTLDRVAHFFHRDAGFLGLVPGGPALAQSHGNLHARILEIVGMGMALRAVADDGHVLALDQG